ncbi:30S ribosomal protein S16 [Patescibacteria group bacterium]
MLSIRLSRVGRKNAPSYRLVIMEKSRDPWAKNLEILGNYNPRMNPPIIELKADRIKHWLSKGAQATDSVWNLLVDQKIVEGKKHSVTHISKKRQGKMEDKVAAAKEKEVEAKAKAEETKAKEAEEAAAAKAEAEAPKEEAPVEESKAEEAPAEPAPEEEKKEEAPVEEKPAEQTPVEEPKEEEKSE